MIEIKVKLKPFSLPNYVLIERPTRPRQEGFIEDPKYHLSELDDNTLEELCRDFRDGVFAKARKRMIK